MSLVRARLVYLLIAYSLFRPHALINNFLPNFLELNTISYCIVYFCTCLCPLYYLCSAVWSREMYVEYMFLCKHCHRAKAKLQLSKYIYTHNRIKGVEEREIPMVRLHSPSEEWSESGIDFGSKNSFSCRLLLPQLHGYIRKLPKFESFNTCSPSALSFLFFFSSSLRSLPMEL
jgi:hypothetical protein